MYARLLAMCVCQNLLQFFFSPCWLDGVYISLGGKGTFGWTTKTSWQSAFSNNNVKCHGQASISCTCKDGGNLLPDLGWTLATAKAWLDLVGAWWGMLLQSKRNYSIYFDVFSICFSSQCLSSYLVWVTWNSHINYHKFQDLPNCPNFDVPFPSFFPNAVSGVRQGVEVYQTREGRVSWGLPHGARFRKPRGLLRDWLIKRLALWDRRTGGPPSIMASLWVPLVG